MTRGGIYSRQSSMRKFIICYNGGAGINLRRLPRSCSISAAAGPFAGSKPMAFAAYAFAPGKSCHPPRLQLGGCRLAAQVQHCKAKKKRESINLPFLIDKRCLNKHSIHYDCIRKEFMKASSSPSITAWILPVSVPVR